MNREEWQNNPNQHSEYYKKVQQLLKEFKIENNIMERCVVHHRDDTEECRKYNEEHYERWGCEEDGTFIDGKYVWFITVSEHMPYHGKQRTGEKNGMFGKKPHNYGKHLSDKHKAKLSENNAHYWKGKHHSDETKAKIKATNKVISDLWKIYKEIDGAMSYNEFVKSLNNNNNNSTEENK